MKNEILVNADRGETRVAVLEKGLCTDLHIERAGAEDMVGSVIKGRVTRVLPGMQAAFVDIGLEKAAFLYVGDYYADDATEDDDEGGGRGRRGRGRNGRGRGARSLPKIENLLREGQEIAVQVAKEAIGTKGARITSNVSIAGRHLVLTPRSRRVGVSRRIDSEKERRRLREIVTRLRPGELGFITRTAGENVREAELEADIRYLSQVWEDIQRRKDEVRAPAVLYREPALPIRVIRDLASEDTRRIVVDSQEAFDEMKAFVDRFVAEPRPRIELYQGDLPLFDAFGVEAQIDASLGKKVFLKSGGYLIIDQSEALTAIDVNTGSYVGKRDLEETVLKTNLDAVKEIVHQLRFRNIGGLIILDFIDMEDAANRDKVHRALREEIRGDKARTNILKISELGLVEMTRKRTRENLIQTLCEPCSYCAGKGFVLSARSVVNRVLRGVRRDLPRFSGRRVAVTVNPTLAEILLSEERATLAELEAELGRAVEVRARPGMHHEQFEVEALDEGPPVAVSLGWLGGNGAAAGDADQADDDDSDGEEAASPPEAPGDVPPSPSGPGTEPAGAAGGEPGPAVDEAPESRILPASQSGGES